MISRPLPDLPLESWEDTRLHLQLICQIVGKVRLKLHPFMNHWWHASLQITPNGFGTGPIPYRSSEFDVEIDLRQHQVVIRTEDRHEAVRLGERPVADFYHEFRDALSALDISVNIIDKPYFCKSEVPFIDDTIHKAYDLDSIERAWQILAWTDGLFKSFRSGFRGKCSPVQLFWHSFDLAVTRFSGRLAPPMPQADPVTREAYSDEVSSAGFWFGDDSLPEPAFYCYAAPAPPGFAGTQLQPREAKWMELRGSPMAILTYKDLRSQGDPQGTLLEFLESSYQAAAAHWPTSAGSNGTAR